MASREFVGAADMHALLVPSSQVGPSSQLLCFNPRMSRKRLSSHRRSLTLPIQARLDLPGMSSRRHLFLTIVRRNRTASYAMGLLEDRSHLRNGDNPRMRL